ncbi:MAG: MFS transporter [Planctomycetota bacterium]
MTSIPQDSSAHVEVNKDGKQIFRCGPLTYTKMGLLTLFGWLLWGDFCFSMMETVIPRILPLRLKELGVSNMFMSFIMSTIPGIMDIAVGAPVSYKSDRHRGPLGRRIPFILYTLPFMGISFIMIGWSAEIGAWLQSTMPIVRNMAPTTLTIALIVIFVVAFHIFNNFVGSVYYYLFNDVVPPQFLGRFNGYFKIVGGAAGALYSYCLFQYQLSHFREIMTGVALLYVVGMGIMCLRVKEGPYPPPPEDEFTGFFGKLKSIGKQSFSTKFYWYFYLTSVCATVGGATGIFNVFKSQQLNLDLKQIGILHAVGAVGGMIATYYAAVFVDRWHPLRIATYNAIGHAFNAYNEWIWLFITLPSALFFWVSLIGSLPEQFSAAMAGLCGIALFMRLMPKSLYGQFSAANAVIRAVGGMCAGLLAGLFLDVVKWMLHGSDFAYRFGFLWSGTFGIIRTVFMCLAYREWLRLGGDEHYQAPAPWLPAGREPAAAQFASVKTIPCWLRFALNLGLVGLAMNLVLMGFFTYEMCHTEKLRAIGHWHLVIWFPLKLWLTATGLVQYWHIMRDIAARERGERTRFGLPHHGVWIVGTLTSLASFPVFWIKTQWMINLGLGYELYILGIANLVGLVLGVLSTQMVRWIERDLTPEEEKRLRDQIAIAEKTA